MLSISIVLRQHPKFPNWLQESRASMWILHRPQLGALNEEPLKRTIPAALPSRLHNNLILKDGANAAGQNISGPTMQERRRYNTPRKNWKHVDCYSSRAAHGNSAKLQVLHRLKLPFLPILGPKHPEQTPIEKDHPARSVRTKSHSCIVQTYFFKCPGHIRKIQQSFEEQLVVARFVHNFMRNNLQLFTLLNQHRLTTRRMMEGRNQVTIGAKNRMDFLFTVTGAIDAFFW